MTALRIGVAIEATRQRADFDFAGGVLPPGATLTRASAASRFTEQRILAGVPVDAPRFDHDPRTGRPRGLLIEAAATNLLLRSSDFGDAVWQGNGLALGVAAVPAPDGSATATLASDTSTTAFGALAQNFGTAGALVTSIHVRKDAVPSASRYALLRMSAPVADVRFDTQSGETAGSPTGFGVQDLGDYWRLWRGGAAGASGISFYPAVGGGGLAQAFSAATTGGATIWGAQVEAGTEPSSYIATGGSAVVRAADRLVLDWGRIGVGNGLATIRYGFDDGSSQIVATEIVAGLAEVPTSLARRHLTRADRI